MLEIAKIKQANTRYLGKNIVYQEEMTSTQVEAKKLIQQKQKETILVVTENQTQGKGTKERIWYSTKESNITMTLLLYPDCTFDSLKGLTKEIANSIIETIGEMYDISLQRKEPNDVLLNGKKIAGILTETASYQNKVKHLLIGIGMNINEMNFQNEIQEIATSLKKEYQKEFNREEIMIRLLEKIENVLIEKKIIR